MRQKDNITNFENQHKSLGFLIFPLDNQNRHCHHKTIDNIPIFFKKKSTKKFYYATFLLTIPFTYIHSI